MDGKSHTGKYRGPQCDPEKHGQCPARVLSHVAQTEPDKKFKEEEYALHEGYNQWILFTSINQNPAYPIE
jgi:hypothetical protein